MKKIIALIISSFFSINTFCQDFIAPNEDCVNYLMVALAKQYLEDGKGKAFYSDNDIKKADSIKSNIKVESIQNFTSFDDVVSQMESASHRGGAEKLKTCREKLSSNLTFDIWKKQCNDRNVYSDTFINGVWNSILKQDVETTHAPEVGSRTSEVESNGNFRELDGRVACMESKINDMSNTTSYIALLLSILSLLGVAYLFYLQKLGNAKNETTKADNYKVSQDDIEKLENKVESLRRTVRDLQKQLEDLLKKSDEKLVPVQPINNQPVKKEEEKTAPEVQQSTPAKQQNIQRIYARPKSAGILREAQDSSYFTIEIKNGKSEALFSGDSMSAIKNQNQYFDGIYDVIDRSGTNKVVVEKNALVLKQSDGTWKVTEKGKLRFK